MSCMNCSPIHSNTCRSFCGSTFSNSLVFDHSDHRDSQSSCSSHDIIEVRKTRSVFVSCSVCSPATGFCGFKVSCVLKFSKMDKIGFAECSLASTTSASTWSPLRLNLRSCQRPSFVSTSQRVYQTFFGLQSAKEFSEVHYLSLGNHFASDRLLRN